MTLENFLSFLQQLLTMVDPKNKSSVELARTALAGVVGLARSSNMADAITLRSMVMATHQFDSLVRNRKDFVGIPGDFMNNQNKRQRLSHMIMPGC